MARHHLDALTDAQGRPSQGTAATHRVCASRQKLPVLLLGTRKADDELERGSIAPLCAATGAEARADDKREVQGTPPAAALQQLEERARRLLARTLRKAPSRALSGRVNGDTKGTRAAEEARNGAAQGES